MTDPDKMMRLDPLAKAVFDAGSRVDGRSRYRAARAGKLVHYRIANKIFSTPRHGLLPSKEVIAFTLKMQPCRVEAGLAACSQRALLVQSACTSRAVGVQSARKWFVANWERHKPKIDSSALRMRRFRQRQQVGKPSLKVFA
jgi:hypothetical protein